jgi:ribokinase
MTPPRILVAGSANLDLVTRVPRCPAPGQTLLGRDFALIPGGKGANQAVAAARLGARVRFAGCVGDDPFGALQRAALAAEGILLDTLRTDPATPTGTAVILVADDGDNAIVVTPGANFAWTGADLDALDAALDDTDLLLTQLEIPAATVAELLRRARARGVPTVLDIGSDQPVPDGLLALADVVSPNESEAARLVGLPLDHPDQAKAAARALRGLGAPRVLLKLGARGALWLDDDGFRAAPAFPVTPVDTTAAGDAFTAAFCTAWGRQPLDEALRIANAAGAVAATRPGAQPAMPTRDDLARMLAAAPIG